MRTSEAFTYASAKRAASGGISVLLSEDYFTSSKLIANPPPGAIVTGR